MQPESHNSTLNASGDRSGSVPSGGNAVLDAQPKGLVRFSAVSVASYRDGEDHVIRVSVDEGQAFEVALPASVAVMFSPRHCGALKGAHA